MSTVFDDTKLNTLNRNGLARVGEVTLHFYEDDTGVWYSYLQELDKRKCRGDLHTVYKLALCMAVVQDTLKQRMGAMDAILRTNAEMKKIKAELDKADVDKYQTKLPFEGEGPPDAGT